MERNVNVSKTLAESICLPYICVINNKQIIKLNKNIMDIENILIETYSKVELFCICRNIESHTDFMTDCGMLPYNTKTDMAWAINYYLKNTSVKTPTDALDFISSRSLEPTDSQVESILNSHGEEPFIN